MSKSVSGERVAKGLVDNGFEKLRTKGDHMILSGPEGQVVVVPLHREVAKGTLGSIMRQSKLSREAFFSAVGVNFRQKAKIDTSMAL